MKTSKYSVSDHAFVICAYKESQYLEECILSLLHQEVQSRIILVTSTPNSHIETLVKKYGLEYHVNTGAAGIAGDWNFAYHTANGELVTIAHQDDIYEPNFVKKVLEGINRCKCPLIVFTDYGELRNSNRVTRNKLLKVKRTMLLPLRSRVFQEIRFIRRRILSIGSPICCPSVTYVKENLPETIFESDYRSDVDWQAWEKLSRIKGAFVYCTDILMFHRIHEDSATTAIIADNRRTKEDLEMFSKFWPMWIANILCKIYKKAEESNYID